MKYDYDFREIPGTYQGRYYYTEQGTVRLEYLPAGNYVLAETENPEGYATADPILINIEETGHLEEIQYFQMGDKPLKLEVSKVDILFVTYRLIQKFLSKFKVFAPYQCQYRERKTTYIFFIVFHCQHY